MKLFEFIGKKDHLAYINNLTEVCKEFEYGIEEIGSVSIHPIHKVVINPKGKYTLCFISGLHGNEKAGPYGILEFLKNNIRIHPDKRVIMLPLVNPHGFIRNLLEGQDWDINKHFRDDELKEECKIVWDAIKNENIQFLHTLHEEPHLKEFYLYYTHHKRLAEDLKTIAEKQFKIYKPSDKIHEGFISLPHEIHGSIEEKLFVEHEVPYIATKTPGRCAMDKRIKYNKEAIKWIIHNV